MNTKLQSLALVLALVHLDQALPSSVRYSIVSLYDQTKIPGVSDSCAKLLVDSKGKFAECVTDVEKKLQDDLNEMTKKLGKDVDKLRTYLKNSACCNNVNTKNCADDADKDTSCSDADRKALDDLYNSNNRANITINGKVEEIICKDYSDKWCKDTHNGKDVSSCDQPLPRSFPYSLASVYDTTLKIPGMSDECQNVLVDPKGTFTGCVASVQQKVQKDLNDWLTKSANHTDKMTEKYLTDLVCCSNIDAFACADDASKDTKCSDADRKALDEFEKVNNKGQITVNGKEEDVECAKLDYTANWCNDHVNIH